MGITGWTALLVGLTFALYIGVAIWSRAGTTSSFYVAGRGVPAIANGMATGADWMSAASFISMAGLISFAGYTGAMYLMGWTGGYVLLALLLAPYLRKYGKFTIPEFVGDRYYSQTARLVAVLCAIFVSFTYVAGQMRGVGIVFSRFLEVDVNTGVVIGMALVFFYAVIGGMRGITYTQVAQYCVLIVAYLIPAWVISYQLTGNPVPQIGFGSSIADGPNAGRMLLEVIDQLHRDLGFPEYTGAFVDGKKSMIDMLAITLALMVGTAGLPHVLIRFYTVKTARAARWSALWALVFIGILYTTAPAIAAFARANLIQTISSTSYTEAPIWFKNWENSGLIAWIDKNGDGKIDYRPGDALEPISRGGRPAPEFETAENGDPLRSARGERLLKNEPSTNGNELYVDRDIMVLANPEIANLPAWVIALVAAGALAAALSTAAGLLLVISSSISHDLFKSVLTPRMSERAELTLARVAAGLAVLVAGYFGIHPPGFVAQVVAYAFGLAASSFFPILVLGIFSKRTTKQGAIAGMLTGILFTGGYIVYFKTSATATQADWLFGISPEGIGSIGMVLNFAVAMTVSRFTAPPPQAIQDLVEHIRLPSKES